MIEAILSGRAKWRCRWQDFAKFHNALAEAVVAVAKKIGDRRVGVERRLFSKPLFDRTDGAAIASGRIPAVLASARSAKRCGIALGQIVAALRTQHEIVNRKS